MKRVTGIGGVFIKAKNPDLLRAWYQKHLGIDIQAWGGTTFRWHTPDQPNLNGSTTWSIFPATSTYFAPSDATFMINYRVENLLALLDLLREEGCDVNPKIEHSEYGKFGWVMDPEGNKIELWEPPDNPI